MDRKAWQAMVHGVAKSQTPQTTNIHDVKHLFMWLFDLYILFMKCLNAFYPLSNWIVFFLLLSFECYLLKFTEHGPAH